MTALDMIKAAIECSIEHDYVGAIAMFDKAVDAGLFHDDLSIEARDGFTQTRAKWVVKAAEKADHAAKCALFDNMSSADFDAYVAAGGDANIISTL